MYGAAVILQLPLSVHQPGWLQVWLRARQRGVLALELVWELDARRGSGSQGRLELRTAQPTQDMAHLARLLAEQLARVTLPGPVLHLRMRSLQTQALAGESISLLPEDVRHGDSLHQLLERLGASLGAERVRKNWRRARCTPPGCWPRPSAWACSRASRNTRAR